MSARFSDERCQRLGVENVGQAAGGLIGGIEHDADEPGARKISDNCKIGFAIGHQNRNAFRAPEIGLP
jgi:hypothetical protein